jgi:hypothetical protein
MTIAALGACGSGEDGSEVRIDPSAVVTFDPTAGAGEVVFQGRYAPITDLCARLDLAGPRRYVARIDTVRAERKDYTGYAFIDCAFGGEQESDDRQIRHVTISLVAHVYSDGRDLPSQYQASRRAGSGCGAGDARRRDVRGIGTLAFETVCDQGRSDAPALAYGLHMYEDNVVVEARISAFALGGAPVPTEAEAAAMARQLVQTGLEALRKP